MPITTEDAEEECTERTHLAAGPDGVEPDRMALLPTSAYEQMAKLVHGIEQGGAWPDGQCTARAAFMQKIEGEQAWLLFES